MPSSLAFSSEIPKRSLDDYRAFLPDEERRLVEELAAPFRGKKILFRCTCPGGRVEVLKSLLPLLNDLGVEAKIEIGGKATSQGYDFVLESPGLSWQPFPAIDPLHPRNLSMGSDEANAIAGRFGINPARPLILQVGRFDREKDFLGVIDSYRLVKEQLADLQLLLVGFLPDRESRAYFNSALRRAGEDFDVVLLTEEDGVGPLEINSFQHVADVVLQKSLKEKNFSLAVSEALWKGRPVIAGGVSQVLDGKTGYLVDSIEECAMRVYQLLKNPDESWELGEMAREHIRENYLLPHLLKDFLTFLSK